MIVKANGSEPDVLSLPPLLPELSRGLRAVLSFRDRDHIRPDIRGRMRTPLGAGRNENHNFNVR